jgi:hypothetical protein
MMIGRGRWNLLSSPMPEERATRARGARILRNQDGTPRADAAPFAVAKDLGRASTRRGSQADW